MSLGPDSPLAIFDPICNLLFSPLGLQKTILTFLKVIHRDIIHENGRGFIRSCILNYVLYVVIGVNLNFLHKNSIREWFGGLKRILISVLMFSVIDPVIDGLTPS